jgi:hypothetical protein
VSVSLKKQLLSLQNFCIDNKLAEALGQQRIFLRCKVDFGVWKEVEPVWVIESPPPFPTVTASFPLYGC